MNIKIFVYKSEQKNFLDYLSLLGETLKKHRGGLEKWLREQESKAITGEDRMGFDAMEEAEYESFSMYSDLAFESFIIWLCGYLENELNQICNRFVRHQKSSLELADIAGRGIERARIFMKKVAKWQLPEEDLWEKLIYLRDIRNAIVHNGGVIKKGKLRNFISRQSKDEIFYWPNGRIVLSEKFCVKLTNFVFDYLRRLIESPSLRKTNQPVSLQTLRLHAGRD